jgi:cytochrome c-type biogenesis protein
MNEMISTATNTLQSTGSIGGSGFSPLITMSVSYGSSFLGGLLSFFSPCVLPLIPVFFGVLMGGTSDSKTRFLRGAFFTLGMSIFFFMLGIGAGGLGQFIREYDYIMNAISGSLFIIFGFMFFFEKGIKGVKINVTKFSGGPIGGFIMGAALGLIWVPCAGPVLGSILVLAANQDTVARGGTLLLTYSLGLSIPFLTLSGFVSKITSRISFTGESKARKITRWLVFIVLLTVGILTIFGQLNILQSLA